MAFTTLYLSSSSNLLRGGALTPPSMACTRLPALPPLPHSLSCGRISRNVVAMSTGEAPAEVEASETPEIVKTIQETWDKVEDKYAVSSIAVAGVLALWAFAGVISALEKLPLVPGVLELVGIGYTGWFTYKNLVFTPEREALIEKIKDTYKEISGIS